MFKIKIFIKKSNEILLPEYKTVGSAGCDLRSSEDTIIERGKIKLIHTGLFLAIPEAFEGQVRTRSGLGKKGVFVINSPGTIDSDYRGEVCVLLCNMSDDVFEIKKGHRIAQLIFSPVVKADFEILDKLPESERGDGGFGHTGIK